MENEALGLAEDLLLLPTNAWLKWPTKSAKTDAKEICNERNVGLLNQLEAADLHLRLVRIGCEEPYANHRGPLPLSTLDSLLLLKWPSRKKQRESKNALKGLNAETARLQGHRVLVELVQADMPIVDLHLRKILDSLLLQPLILTMEIVVATIEVRGDPEDLLEDLALVAPEIARIEADMVVVEEAMVLIEEMIDEALEDPVIMVICLVDPGVVV